jgi:hypothetical protein
VRKINPADVKSDFDQQLTALNDFYVSGIEKFSGDAEKSTYIENCMLVLAVAWEGFVNDLFIAYINRNPDRFKQHLRNALDHHLLDAPKPQKIFNEFGVLRIPTHLSKKQVQDFADEAGGNITFSNFEKLEEKASAWLVANDAQRFANLSAQQKGIVDAIVALRNHIAHRSEMSSKNMNAKLERGQLHLVGLRRGRKKVAKVGAWLKAKPPGRQATRFSMFLTELKAIGASV